MLMVHSANSESDWPKIPMGQNDHLTKFGRVHSYSIVRVVPFDNPFALALPVDGLHVLNITRKSVSGF